MRLRRNDAERERDFSEEADVRAEMAEALGVPESSLRIELVTTYGYDAWVVSARGSGRAYTVVYDVDTADGVAQGLVYEELVDRPESFGRDFLEPFVDKETLYDELLSDLESTTWRYALSLSERDDDEFWNVAASVGISPTLDEDGEVAYPDGADIETLSEALAKRELKDPVEHLVALYGEQQGILVALRTGGFDEELAAEEAVQRHGSARFLGKVQETPVGFAYWRTTEGKRP